MAEFEEKLNAILSNPEAMGQIMSLAQSLSGGKGAGPAPDPASGPASEVPREAPVPDSPPGNLPGPFSEPALLGSLDPSLLQLGTRLLREYQGEDSRNTALLMALKPFLKEEKQERLDRAIQAARIIRLIRVGLGALGRKEEGHV